VPDSPGDCRVGFTSDSIRDRVLPENADSVRGYPLDTWRGTIHCSIALTFFTPARAPGQSRSRNATGPRFFRDPGAGCERRPEGPKIAELPKGRSALCISTMTMRGREEIGLERNRSCHLNTPMTRSC
jgi:hypothetical protein